MATVIVQWRDVNSRTPKVTSLALWAEKKDVSKVGPLRRRHHQRCRPRQPNCPGLLKCLHMSDYPCVQLKSMKMEYLGEKTRSPVGWTNVGACLEVRCRSKLVNNISFSAKDVIFDLRWQAPIVVAHTVVLTKELGSSCMYICI